MPECCSLSSLPATFFWRFLQFFSIFSRFFPRFLAKIRLRWCLLIYNRKNHKRRSKKWTLRETAGPLNCLERGIVMRMVRGHGRLHAGDCGKERGNRTRWLQKWYWFGKIAPWEWVISGLSLAPTARAKILKFARELGSRGNRIRWIQKWHRFDMMTSW